MHELKKSRPSAAKNVAQIRPHVVHWARLLDQAFRIPGTSIQIGLDGIVGLIPGVGDAVTVLAAGMMLREAKRLGLPSAQRARIIWNYAVDLLCGMVPVVGDLFDVAFKANMKNIAILEKHVDDLNRHAGHADPIISRAHSGAGMAA